jgi:hypothetical protein
MKKLFLKTKYTLGIITGLAIGFSYASHAMAAAFDVHLPKDTLSIHETIQVDIVLDSENQNINTVSGSLVYDRSRMKLERVSTGNSLVNFWLHAPAENIHTGEIDFSGIIPGGVVVSSGQLFSVVFSGIRSGIAQVSVQDAHAYVNDGMGTEALISPRDKNITVTQDVAEHPERFLLSDHTDPERFTITRTRDAAIFDGQWFAVFASQDKDSGIAFYTFCESLVKKCTMEESPVLLKKQSRWYVLIAKAYDHNGNMRKAIKISPLFVVGGGVLLLLLLGGILWKYVVHRKKRKSAA